MLRENRKYEDGKIRYCGPKFHYQKDCGELQRILIEESSHHTSFIKEKIDYNFSTQLMEDIEIFTREARNCASLDTCCSSSVAGKPWLDMYMRELDQRILKPIPEVFLY